jgi:Cu2+-exporting ATPase
VPRPESAAVVQSLRKHGIGVYMISGDHEAPTRHLADQLGIEHWFADTLPEDKARHIRRLRELGRSMCFVGDGINDTIAMKEALVSVSVNGATTAATDTAGIVLMDSNLELIGKLMELSRAYQRNLRTSFSVALGPGLVGLAGIFFFGLGIYGTLVLYSLSMALGATNAMLPLIRDRPAKAVQIHRD